MNRREFATSIVAAAAVAALPAIEPKLKFDRNGIYVEYDGKFYHLSVPWDISSARELT